jgi:nucleotide-binding universal stress UspA family protein
MKIMIAYDGSEFAKAILDDLHYAGLPSHAEVAVVALSPATDVIETARWWRADCVFIGAEQMSFIERIFCGDFVVSVASQAECSVEVVRGPSRRDVANFDLHISANHKDSLPAAS